ncbi:replication protein A 32 kDa subunit isoform X3 [Cryptotermes secundus]|uniref:replication protein A 32 kDa subunit isoform X3 n=1 Tax=Cryptotermes secundus TaxID=105785 RepID=UPI000CD7CBEC|nr:replication protein A 32 kDa subunit isoform X3 [Cryptotermes secundus]
MWDSRSYGNDQGGFFNSPSQFASPSEKQDKPARRVQNIVPVTVRQILESREDGLKIGSMDVHMEEQQVIPSVVENMYCRVYASLRTSQGKKHIFVFRIMNLDNLNDLTRHILEVMYSSLKIQKIKTSEITMNSHANSNISLASSFMATSASNQPSGFSPQQNLVYSTISKCGRDIGAHRDEVIKALEGKMSAREVMNVVDFLSNEGHIYTTIDDDHFRCTDN